MSSPSTLNSAALIRATVGNIDLVHTVRWIFKLKFFKPPGVYKYAFYLLLLLNVKSLPFAWHLRVFRPVFEIHFRRFLVSLRFRLTKSRAERKIAMDKWFEELPSVGTNPFEAVITYKSRATIDDSDFNGHLSNSSYAKTFDSARFKAALSYVPSFLRAGGWIALGATHFHFVREIPMLSKYEVRISMVGWDNKWIFVVGRYVTHRKSTKKPLLSTTVSPPETFKASLRTPANPLDTPATPPGANGNGSTTPVDAMKAFKAAQLAQEEPDGATLHCLTISQLCFKHGRITVPPAIVLAADGFSVPSPSEPYSHANPPPHWARVQALRSPRAGGSMKAFRQFLRGGWRDGEQWWEQALGGEVEEKRRANMNLLNGLRTGMEGARAMY